MPGFHCHSGPIYPVSSLECMAGTTGLEPATSAVTGQRSDQLSYVPRLFFNNLDICHIESSVSQLSLFSLFSTISPLWTQFWDSVDTTWTPRWTPKPSPQRQDQFYQKRPFWCPRFLVIKLRFCSLPPAHLVKQAHEHYYSSSKSSAAEKSGMGIG